MEDINTAKGIMVSLKQCWIPWEKERREQRENRDATNWLGKTLCVFFKRVGKTLSRDDREFEPHKYKEVNSWFIPSAFSLPSSLPPSPHSVFPGVEELLCNISSWIVSS